MSRTTLAYLFAALMIAIIAGVTSTLLPVLGLASSALLFLLPVLLASSRGGLGPGLFAAFAGALAYNYFLLEPRFTLQIHRLDNVVSVVMLTCVAVVTSRLALGLRREQAQAEARALASEQAAALSTVLATGEPAAALAAGISLLKARFGEVLLLRDDHLPNTDAGFSSLDLSAAAWTMHNRDMTGHGTEIMAASDWTFLPLRPKSRREGDLAAFARPATGETRHPFELAHLKQLAALLGNALDRLALEGERRDRERLEDGERLRRAFLASLAHDFRTPLTVLTGELQSLRDGRAEIEAALAAARKLDLMMNDLIGAARLEDGSLRATIESVDLVDVVSAADQVAAFPPGIRLLHSVPADLPFLRADPVLLRHVLVNLIDNAARHARGVVEISAKRSGTLVSLSVHDDGPGIPADQRKHIFQRFARVDGSDRKSGSGLGLAIVAGFAEAMGAQVSVSEGPRGGACFSLLLAAVAESVT